MKFVDIKTKHLQDVIRTCGKGHGTLRKIKVLFNQLFKFAMQNDIVNKDYSQFVDIGKNTDVSTRVPFSKNEIDRLFQVQPYTEWVDTILIMIYTGLRISELLLIKAEDVDLQESLLKGGIKTEAGKNRVIPINKKILPMIAKRVSEGHEFLIVNHENKQMLYDNFYKEKWKPIMQQLGMKHKPHDCRHTWFTLMDNAEANKVAIKKIGGHASYETSEKIYTHKDIEELRKAIDKI